MHVDNLLECRKLVSCHTLCSMQFKVQCRKSFFFIDIVVSSAVISHYSCICIAGLVCMMHIDIDAV